MAFQVLSLQKVDRGRGVQVIAYSRTGRGQKFIVGRVDIDPTGKTKEEVMREVAQAVRLLHPSE